METNHGINYCKSLFTFFFSFGGKIFFLKKRRRKKDPYYRVLVLFILFTSKFASPKPNVTKQILGIKEDFLEQSVYFESFRITDVRFENFSIN